MANHIIFESDIKEDGYHETDLFGDSQEQQETEKEKMKLSKERERQKAILSVHKKYGKNTLLKGMNYEEGATTRERNGQIGGHKA